MQLGAMRDVDCEYQNAMLLRLSVGNSSINKPMHLQNVMCQAHQGPFAAHLLKPAQRKLSEAARLLDLAKDGFTMLLRAAYTAAPAFVCILRVILST